MGRMGKCVTCVVLVAALCMATVWLTACGRDKDQSHTPSGHASEKIASGEALLDAGKLTEAESAFREAVAIDANSVSAQMGLGNVYVRQGRLVEAETAYRAVLKIAPNSAAAHANLGVVHYQREDLVNAAKEFEAALHLEPGDAKALYLLGAVRLQQDDLAGAEKLFLQASEAAPDLPEVYYGLGVLYKLRGEKDKAIAAFEKFLTVGPPQDPQATGRAQEELRQLRGQ